MLIAAGPGVANLKDYTNNTEMSSIEVSSSQGDTLPTLKCQIWDPLSSFTIADEVDIVVLDEYDPNGWPTVNIVTNPQLEGTFTGGVVASWTALQTGTGITYRQDPVQTCQEYIISNAANGVTVGVFQSITLPKDELGNSIVALPYAFSCSILPNAALVNTSLQLKIDWYNASSTLVGSSTRVITSLILTNTWARLGLYSQPPSTAVSANVTISSTTSSATNSASITLFGAQFEYATFGNVKSMAYNPYIEGPKMDYFGSGGVSDGWLTHTITGATFASVTSPVYSNITAQSITLSNATNSSSANIWQNTHASPYGTYTISMAYQIQSALVGCSASVTVVSYDSANNVLATAKSLVSIAPLNNWNMLSLRIGPNTANPLPLTTDHIGIMFGLDTTAATNSGTIYIGQAFAIADPIQQQLPNATQTAVQAGLYPTAYCDPGTTGCHADTGISGFGYRQLRFFGGYIRTTSFDYSTTPERIIDVDAVGYGILLQESPANLIIRNLQDTAAIAAAFQYGTNQGFLVGVDYTTFVKPISIVDSLTFNWNSTKDVLNQIANLTVADWWVDEYKFLHYQPSLASPGPYNFSDQPNFTSTYPMAGWKFDNDSTQSLTTKIFEGGTVLSLPVTQTFHGVSATLSAGLTSGNTYTSISVNATTTIVDAGTILTINNGTTSQQVTVATTASSGATTITVNSFIANANYVSTNTVIAFSYLLNGGSAISQVNSVSLSSVAQSVGISGVNTFAQGYAALVDVDTATLTFNSAPPNGPGVSATYQYSAPVIVRLRNGGAETVYGAIRRRIHHHQQDETVTSITTAISRAASEVKQYSQPRPIGVLKFYSPPAPLGVHLQPGLSIQVTHASSGLSAELFQIQKMTVTQVGPGAILYELGVGFYRVDLAMMVYQGRQSIISSNVSTQGTVINDVLSINDGWMVTDTVPAPIVINVGQWGTPTTSTWGGTFAWG